MLFAALRIALLGFCLLFLLPLAVYAATHYGAWPQSWAAADWSSAKILPPAVQKPEATVRIYAARTGRWKSIFAVHSWIVLKDAGASSYERYDKVGWGTPIRRNNYAPDARWFGNEPELVFAADGAAAEALLPKMRAAIAAYAYRGPGDYRAWPGPNSNTFVAFVVAQVPELAVALPPTAIGKDFPADGAWFGLTPSRTGVKLNLGGYFGVALGWVEGIEINVLGAVAGLDVRRPGLKLPGFGRLGM